MKDQTASFIRQFKQCQQRRNGALGRETEKYSWQYFTVFTSVVWKSSLKSY